MLRCAEPGWTLEVRDDPSGRRGIWTRRTGDRLELCSGREGDDWYLCLEPGQVLTAAMLHTLWQLVGHGRAPDIEYDLADHGGRQRAEPAA